MGVLSFLQSVYEIDTLDTRFVTPSRTPYQTKAEPRKPIPHAQPPRWKTVEFYYHYLIFVLVVPVMFWTVYNVSRPSDPRYFKYQGNLSPGWVPGRKIDVSDHQYQNFRNSIPYLAALVVFHPLLRRLWNFVFSIASKPTAGAAEARLKQRVSLDFVFALPYLLVLHGFSALKVLLILCINYGLATALLRKHVPVATWVFNICLLFANKWADGYKYENMARFVGASGLVEAGKWMDAHGGLQSRWEILFNITMLRLISFNLDYYWSLDRLVRSPIEYNVDPAHLSEHDRVNTPAAASDYSFRNCVAYTVYAPLYLTGPILTFNDYMWQQRYRPASIERPRTLRYGVRFVLLLLSMELLLHYAYVCAIAKASPDWLSYTPAQLSMLSFFNLHIIWLKLLIPWRFFRLWALVDGVDPPENLVRCVSNNFSAFSFWRSWHRSFYRWSLRYIYIPLGGASWKAGPLAAARSVLTYLAVFTFVAFWHDIEPRLFVWGWLVVLFMLPEILAGFAFPEAGRYLRGVGAMANVLLMMAANLVGFAVGVDGLKRIVEGILYNCGGLAFLIIACGALYTGIQVMFEIRQAEFRKGIDLKC